MSNSEDTDHFDYDDLTDEEVSEYVDEYFWGDDDVDEGWEWVC